MQKSYLMKLTPDLEMSQIKLLKQEAEKRLKKSQQYKGKNKQVSLRLRKEAIQILQLVNENLLLEDQESTLNRYKTKPADFIHEQLKIFNPDLQPAKVDFKLFQFQRDFIEKNLYPAYMNSTDILDEKTRQMGLSWLYMSFLLWALLFDPDFSGFTMSYKEGLVDDGGTESSMNSLFGKLRFMYDELGEQFKKELGYLTFKHLRIKNTKTGAYLVGESANVNAGRGGSYKIAIWDETAATPKSENIFQSFKQAGRCKCYNSTVRGKGNVFARLRFDPNAGVKISTIHWSEHPFRNKDLKIIEGKKWSSWYEKECRGMTDAQVAQELDIDYETSAVGRIYAKLNNQTHLKPLSFNKEWYESSIIAWDLGVSDETFATIMQLDNQGNLGVVDELCGTDEEIRFYIDLILGIKPAGLDQMSIAKRTEYSAFLQRSKENQYWRLLNIGGPDSTQRSITSKRSVRDQFIHAGRFGFDERTNRLVNRRYRNLRFIPLTGYKIMDRIIAFKSMIDPAHNKFIVSDKCHKLWERLMNYKWLQSKDGDNRETPDHDWASHGSDSCGYGVLYFVKHKKVLGKPGGY